MTRREVVRNGFVKAGFDKATIALLFVGVCNAIPCEACPFNTEIDCERKMNAWLDEEVNCDET